MRMFIIYMLKALALALCLSSPLYPALWIAATIERPVTVQVDGCVTDTECLEMYGTDEWFEDTLD